MKNTSGDGLFAELDQVGKELAVWRETPGKGPKIPELVWQGAVRAAKRHGVYPVCKALNLDYNCLRNRMEESRKRRQTRMELIPAFVEVKPEASSADPGCVVELEKGNGTRLRICAKAASTVDWNKIKEVFLGA
jgi:hypothetical protein